MKFNAARSRALNLLNVESPPAAALPRQAKMESETPASATAITAQRKAELKKNRANFERDANLELLIEYFSECLSRIKRTN